MKIQKCTICSQDQSFIEFDNSYVCSTNCEEINLQKNIETKQSKNTKVNISLKVIPVEIKITNSKFIKSVGWSVAGETNIIDTLASIINFSRLAEKKNFYYTVKFSNGVKEVLSCDVEKLPLELFVWSWRIKEEKIKKDYITFGLDFSKLKRNMIISNSQIDKKLALYIKSVNITCDDELIIELRKIGLMKLLKTEIYRYFCEEKKDMVLPSEVSKGLKIPSKTNEILNVLFGIGVLVFIFGSCVANTMSPEPTYNQSVINRTGVGSTIDSAQELIDVCKVVMRDKGMSRSKANRRCN